MKLSILTAIVLLLAATAGAAAADEFSAYWHDGKAEMNGYRLTVSRYGQERAGYAVMIFVTEPFSESKRVKVNDHTKSPEDTFDAFKLNLVRDFQTGIYDYNTMVSVFTRSSDFEPVKITFSSAEWCGHVYEELLFETTRVRVSNSSYFEDESSTRFVPFKQGTVSEDNLFVLLRGLRGDFLKPGESKSVDYLPGVFFSRLTHKAVNPVRAIVSRRAGLMDIEVPAGKFSVMVYDVTTDGRNGVFYVEVSYPRRIVRWELAPDLKGELTGSQRMKYWSLNHEGDEKHLEQLGIPVYDR
jgi:hypothetical protein